MTQISHCKYCKGAAVPSRFTFPDSRKVPTPLEIIYDRCLNGCEESLHHIETLKREKLKVQNLKNLRTKIGIKECHYDSTFDNFKVKTSEQKKAFDICKGISKRITKGEKAKGILLCGKAGNGKTHLAVSILREIVENESQKELDRSKMYFTTLAEFNDRVRESYNIRGVNKTSIVMDHIYNVPVLVLDDVGKEYSKTDNFGFSWTSEQFFKILDYRHGTNRVTIMTSNLSRAEMAKKFGEPAISRMHGMMFFSEVIGEDHRSLWKKVLKIVPKMG